MTRRTMQDPMWQQAGYLLAKSYMQEARRAKAFGRPDVVAYRVRQARNAMRYGLPENYY